MNSVLIQVPLMNTSVDQPIYIDSRNVALRVLFFLKEGLMQHHVKLHPETFDQALYFVGDCIAELDISLTKLLIHDSSELEHQVMAGFIAFQEKQTLMDVYKYYEELYGVLGEKMLLGDLLTFLYENLYQEYRHEKIDETIEYENLQWLFMAYLQILTLNNNEKAAFEQSTLFSRKLKVVPIQSSNSFKIIMNSS